MQHRMKTHPLTEQQILHLLERAQTACLSTLNPDGTPYSTPVHFIYYQDAIFIHGLPKGKKLENISRDCRVGVTVYEMDKLLLDPSGRPCETNTKYESVIISGSATLVNTLELKSTVLRKIVEKYTPHLVGAEIPSNMTNGTAVIQIEITSITGKYYS